MEVINTLGRRKAAVARVYLKDGNGSITVNGKDYKEYFSTETLQYIVMQPLNLLNVAAKYDIKANLDGGGVKGQAEALRLGISRALVKINEEDKSALRTAGFMTRDPREVERKKPGQPKARKRFQFSKR
jgi:small subunit ribosomal protein S9